MRTRTRTRAKPAALLLLAVFAAILLAVHGLPVVGAGTSTTQTAGTAGTGGPGGLSAGGATRDDAAPGAATEGAVVAAFGLGSATTPRTLPFTVTGSVSGLTPGVWRPVAATVHNPNAVAIRVTSLALSVALDSTPPGCRTVTNLEIEQPSWGGGAGITLAPGATSTLAAKGVRDPRIRLRDLPDVNQDVCKGKSFLLVWSGTATS